MIDKATLIGKWRESIAEKDGISVSASDLSSQWDFSNSGIARYIVESGNGKVVSGNYPFDLIYEKGVPTLYIDGQPVGRIQILDAKVLVYETASRTRYTFLRFNN